MSGIEVIAELIPQNYPTADFPILQDHRLVGGWRTVADVTARDAIGSAYRREGMAVWTAATSTLYTLNGDLSTWTAFSGGGGGTFGLDLLTVTPTTQKVVGLHLQRTNVSTTPYAVTSTDSVIWIVDTSAPVTVNLLPAATAGDGNVLTVVDAEVAGAGAGTNNVTINRSGSDLINGATSATINTNGGGLTLQSDGTSRWTVIGKVT